jgi:hypothetical protein
MTFYLDEAEARLLLVADQLYPTMRFSSYEDPVAVEMAELAREIRGRRGRWCTINEDGTVLRFRGKSAARRSARRHEAAGIRCNVRHWRRGMAKWSDDDLEYRSVAS